MPSQQQKQSKLHQIKMTVLMFAAAILATAPILQLSVQSDLEAKPPQSTGSSKPPQSTGSSKPPQSTGSSKPPQSTTTTDGELYITSVSVAMMRLAIRYRHEWMSSDEIGQ